MAATVWKGHLTFGLVSLPVKLFTAARAESISFNQLHRSDHSRVRQVLYCQAEDQPVSRSELVKGYEYEKDRYVVIEDEDIKKMAPKSAKVMEILEFVKEAQIDPIYYESSYYVAPDEAGEKPYSLLFQALKQSGYVALAKIAMHNREHIVILRPSLQGITLHTMYYEDEIRKTESFRTDTTMVKEKELGLALMLIESLAAEFEPGKYFDAYRQNLRAMIDAKIQGQEIVAPAEVQQTKVIDIMDALKASLAALKKPAAAEEAEPAAAPKVRRGGA
jgi:DNA end-binding protein Ku